jgi:hypothetical protein
MYIHILLNVDKCLHGGSTLLQVLVGLLVAF